MPRRLLSLLLIALCAGLPAVHAGAAERASPPAAHAEPAPPPPASLDDLFKRLAAAKDEAEAKGVAGIIERRWAHSGSDTADLLVSRALDAMRAKDAALAVELLDRVIALEPRWPEGWNRRATAFLLLSDPASAMRDIQETIAREPRHYSAWSSLGQLYLANDDKKRALEAFRRAQALHPFYDDVRSLIDRLRPDVEGREL